MHNRPQFSILGHHLGHRREKTTASMHACFVLWFYRVHVHVRCQHSYALATPIPPPPLFPSSPSIEHLRDLLKRAPKLKDGLGNAENVTQDYFIGEEFDGFTGYSTFSWSTGYLDDLFKALIDVLSAHGRLGWEHIRWEVYDKASK